MKRKGAHLGQHFLHASWAISAICDAAHIDERTTVLEVGPGKGVLTRALLARAGKVIAIEKDSELVSLLRETFAEAIANGKLILIEDDIRNADITAIVARYTDGGRAAAGSAVRERNESQASRTDLYGERGDDVSDKEMRARSISYVVVANIPYYITGEIIRMFLTAAVQPSRMALLIQKEVAERIVARDGKESILSLSVKVFGVPRVVRSVPRGAFTPPPSVDSAILSIDTISRSAFRSADDEVHFFRIVKTAFASKRKMLAGNLRAIAAKEDIASACEACGIAPDARAEDVPLPKWLCLAKSLRLGN